MAFLTNTALLVILAAVFLPASRPPAAKNSRPTARALVAELGCGACHSGISTNRDFRDLGPSLDSTAKRRSRGYVLDYLRHPERQTVSEGRARMPDFHLDDREALALTLFLTRNGARSASDDLERQFVQLRSANRVVTAEQGRQIFQSQNCAGCHRFGALEPWRNGPDLRSEGARVRPEWLRAYLSNPSPVRPFGTQPGSGSRMPNYRLTRSEADSLGAILRGRRSDGASARVRPLSPFGMAKAESLIRDQLSCLGCHRLGDNGGRIGPDLSQAGRRLDPSFVRAMIANPQRTVPGTIMPKVPMPAATLDLISRFLMQRAATPADTMYPSLIDEQLILPSRDSSAPQLYASNCAPCHGLSGKGDGFNARHLPIPPAMHASRETMSLRSDDTIYDAIHAGAYMLGRSNRMPGFGETLSRSQVDGLVRYIRTMCDCEGPSWSRDGGASRR